MRARLAMYLSQIQYQLREVLLKDKPLHMLALSPKGSVPVLLLPSDEVIDESVDIMLWAFRQNDPGGMMTPERGEFNDMMNLVKVNDTAFKFHLDRYKYPNRFEPADMNFHRNQAEAFLAELDRRLQATPNLFGDALSFADLAIAPFVRQFAHVDRTWFAQTPYKDVQRWLKTFLDLDMFGAVMQKYEPWIDGDRPIYLGAGIKKAPT